VTEVVIAPLARRDVAERAEYLQARNPAAAGAFVVALGAVFSMLADGNVDGAEVRLRNGQHVRRWPLPPMVIFYQRHPALVRIARVYHMARRPIAR
jgi:plasmid stabilization system protein ParE